MDKETRNAIERRPSRRASCSRRISRRSSKAPSTSMSTAPSRPKAGAHLSARQHSSARSIVAAIEHKRAAGMSAAEAVSDYLRDAAFTTLNRFVALKMLEARELVQECITKGEQSAGYREFCGMAPGLPLLPDSAGYRLYIESLFDELSTEVKVLFDRRDPSSVLWPKRATFEQLLEILNAAELAGVWGEDETIGWVYQFFNGAGRAPEDARGEPGAAQQPRAGRAQPVLHAALRRPVPHRQHARPHLVRDAGGEDGARRACASTWCASPTRTCAPRAKKDPRDLRVLDPACGSGHFLLYCFDLLLAIYEEAWADASIADERGDRQDAAGGLPRDSRDLRPALPGLILAHNLHGVDIDPRCAQIAQLALWMRAQRAYRDFGIGRAERPLIKRATSSSPSRCRARRTCSRSSLPS